MKDKLEWETGALFPPALAFVGKLVFAIGLVSILFAPLFGVFVLAVGGYVGFGKTGVELLPEQDKYREFTKIFWFRFGKPKSYKDFPFLSVMRTKLTSSAYSLTNRSASTGSDLYYDVYMLSQSHRSKVLIRRFSALHDAKVSAQELGAILSKEVVMYSPVISAASRAKR